MGKHQAQYFRLDSLQLQCKIKEDFLFQKFSNSRSYNIYTRFDRRNIDRPERRTPMVWNKLNFLYIDVAALSETRFPAEANIKEVLSNFLEGEKC